MELSASILGIALAVTLGAMSPGPSFLLVARTSLAASRQDGLAGKAWFERSAGGCSMTADIPSRAEERRRRASLARQS